MTPAFRTELHALYDEADAALASVTCDGSARCCRFRETGREPYPTAIEAAELFRALAAGGGAARRRLPQVGDCPLLDREGRCSVYEARPFGCRTYFCERAEGEIPRRQIQRIARQIASLSERYAPKDPGPRPLTRWLHTWARPRK